ncbi:hypothetical protein [Endozoicomonas sp.]|uniref:hypothetical protein n=1 Tax=Endozoicomonas sp. TaxID=1892382 RepID=UPI00383BB49B
MLSPEGKQQLCVWELCLNYSYQEKYSDKDPVTGMYRKNRSLSMYFSNGERTVFTTIRALFTFSVESTQVTSRIHIHETLEK